MKIAQVAPLFESVPPMLYGGTERVVSFLTEELVAQGHDVTLFASGDSRTSGRLLSPWPHSLRLDKNCEDQFAHHILMLEMLQQRIEEFDIVHYHTGYLHFPMARYNRRPNVTTFHGRLNTPDTPLLYREFRDLPVVSISQHQRTPYPEANWVGTVYHGLPTNLLRFQPQGGKYLAFLGRISPEKGLDKAIEIALSCEIPLKIAAKVDKQDEAYFQQQINPLLDHPLIEYIGEIDEKKKSEFLGNALALLFPINWPEPFGLVVIEAMACGTPVVAFRKGSVPEVVEDGITGFIVGSVEEAIMAVREKIGSLDRNLCRKVFENRFSAERMASDYLQIYQQEIDLKLNREFLLKKTI